MISNLFDANFYRAANPDLNAAGLTTDAQVFSHFQNYGLKEGRTFSPFVNLNLYRSSNPDLAAAGLTTNSQLLQHLQNYGIAEGRRFSPFVDINFYLATNSDVNQVFKGNREAAFQHLQTYGIGEGRQISQFFNLNYYQASNLDLSKLNYLSLLEHFELYGLKEGRLFSVPFDVNYYRQVNPDLIAAGLNNQQLYEHFQTYGLTEGRASSPFFNVSYYRANNSDLVSFNNQQAYNHYVTYGLREARFASPVTGGDYAGNTLSASRNININSKTIFRDFVGSSDANDYYRFNLSSTSNFNLTLTGLTANISVELLNSSNVSIATTNSSTTAQLSANNLATDTYYVRIFTGNNSANTFYNLELSATRTHRFQIQYDYRFDTNNFFADPARKSVLEEAANIWENYIQNDFPTVPAGTSFTLQNPQTGNRETVSLNNSVDDLVIFVGAQNIPLSQKALAFAGYDGTDTSDITLRNRLSGSNFEPWAGTITFNSSPTFLDGIPTSWFFDLTPETSNDIPTNSVDFLSTALHEIGHILGIGTAPIFKTLGAGGSFVGTNAKSVNGGNPIPLESDLSHIQAGFLSDGRPVLLTSNNPGGRLLPTRVDLAVLADIGYNISGFSS